MRLLISPIIQGLPILAVVVSSSVAHATNYTVTTTAMTQSWDGQCSLVEAISASNFMAANFECPAGTGTDLIELGAGTFTSTQTLYVYSDLTITGAGRAQTRIAGNFASSLADILFSVENSLKLNRLTVRNDTNNPNIYSTGIAVWPDAYLYSDEGLRVTGWTWSGIYIQSGSAHLYRTKIDFNTNKYPSGDWNHGGGIFVDDVDVEPFGHQTHLVGCLVANNTADGDGGGLYFNSNGAAQLTYSTFAYNKATRGGGIFVDTFSNTSYFESDHLTIGKNTATFTGGGFEEYHDDGGVLALRSAIIADNSAFSGPNVVRGSAHPIEATNSIWGSGVDSTSLSCGVAGSDCAGSEFGMNPMFGPLMTMGGVYHYNEVLTLLKGSTAIDQYSGSAQPVDQRGVSVPQNGDNTGTALTDAGAFEKNLNWQAEDDFELLMSAGDSVNPDSAGYPSGQLGRVLQANAAGDFVTYVVGIAESGTYNITVKYKRAPAGGKFVVGTSSSPSSGFSEFTAVQNGYSSSITFPTAVSLGTRSFNAPGKYYIRFRVTDKGTGNGFNVFNDYVKVHKV
jgi:hypothetical protein